jgi:hypothetical protein
MTPTPAEASELTIKATQNVFAQMRDGTDPRSDMCTPRSDTGLRPARQTVPGDSQHPSRLTLPLGEDA